MNIIFINIILLIYCLMRMLHTQQVCLVIYTKLFIMQFFFEDLNIFGRFILYPKNNCLNG